MILPWRNVALGPLVISTSITFAEADALSDAARGLRVLEIGAAYGYSTCRLAQVAESLTSIDPHEWIPDSLKTLRSNLSALGLGADILVGRSQRILPMLAADSFDMAFIDGDHACEAVIPDILQSLRVTQGEVYLHDYYEDTCPGVKQAVDTLGLQVQPLVDTLVRIIRK